MNLIKEKFGENGLIVKPIGSIDANSYAIFEHNVTEELDGIKEFILDLEKVDYISSMGLRAILAFQKIMDEQGSMVVKNVSDEIMEIFKIVGFDSIFHFE